MDGVWMGDWEHPAQLLIQGVVRERHKAGPWKAIYIVLLCYCYCYCYQCPVWSLMLRDAIYHSMNDRGVYLPDDYNSDAPPAQVS